MNFCPYCGKELSGNHCDCEGYKMNISGEEVREKSEEVKVNSEEGRVNSEELREKSEEVRGNSEGVGVNSLEGFDINKIVNFLVDGITHPFKGIKKINDIGLINTLITMALISIVSGVGAVLCVKNLASSVLSSVFKYSFYGMSMDIGKIVSLKVLYISIPLVTLVVLLALSGAVYAIPVIFKRNKMEFKDALAIVVYPFVLPTVIGALAVMLSFISGTVATILLSINIYLAIYLIYGSIINNIEIGRSKALYVFAAVGALLLCIYGALFYNQILSAVESAVDSGINNFFDGLF